MTKLVVEKKLSKASKKSTELAKIYQERLESLLKTLKQDVMGSTEERIKALSRVAKVCRFVEYLTNPKALKALSNQFKQDALKEAAKQEGFVCTMEIWRNLKLRNPDYLIFEEKSSASSKARVGQFLVVKALKQGGFDHGGLITQSNRLWNCLQRKALKSA